MTNAAHITCHGSWERDSLSERDEWVWVGGNREPQEATCKASTKGVDP